MAKYLHRVEGAAFAIFIFGSKTINVNVIQIIVYIGINLSPFCLNLILLQIAAPSTLTNQNFILLALIH